jgi:TPP-dependent pyruvate/acetoin dehydrogenase alpha subunit
VLTEADIEKINKEVDEEVEEMDRFGVESPPPDPSIMEKVLYAE